MPYQREHAAPQGDVAPGREVRRWSPDSWPDGVDGVYCMTDDGGWRLVSVRFDAARWTPTQARQWLRRRGLRDAVEPAVEQATAMRALPSDAPGRYESIDFTAPEDVRQALQSGVEMYEAGRAGDGLEVATVREARRLIDGEPATVAKVRKAAGFFGRNARFGESGASDAQRTSWLIWGGAAGRDWFGALVRQMDAADEREGMRAAWLPTTTPAAALRYAGAAPVPEGMTVGRPFRSLLTGITYGRFTGQPFDDAPALTRAHLEDMARLIRERRVEDPVVIDFDHGTRLGETPEQRVTLGQIIDAWVTEDTGCAAEACLVLVPAFNAHGRALVERSAGALWSSPEYTVRTIYDRLEPGLILGTAMVLAVSLTPRPAQTQAGIDAVMLSEAAAQRRAATTPPQDPGTAPGRNGMDYDAIHAALVGLGLSEDQARAICDAMQAEGVEDAIAAGLAAAPEGADADAIKALLGQHAAGGAEDEGGAEGEQTEMRAEVPDEELQALREKAAEADALREELDQLKATHQALLDEMQAQGGEPAMRSQLASFRSELTSLRSEVAAQKQKAKAAEDAARKLEVDVAYERALGGELIVPAEEANFRSAYAEKQQGRPGWFDAQFGSRTPGEIWTRSEIGHGGRPPAAGDDSAKRTERAERAKRIQQQLGVGNPLDNYDAIASRVLAQENT